MSVFLDNGSGWAHSERAVSKTQFWILNCVGGVCALLILVGLVMVPLNQRLNKSVVATQNQFNQAQQLQTTAQNLILRIAQAGQTESSLRDLLARHDFKVNLNSETQPNPNP